MKREEMDESSDYWIRSMEFSRGNSRPISAPPADKLFIGDDIELGDIQTDLSYSMFYRRNCKNEPRLQPPNFFIRGQNGYWTTQHDDLIARAFMGDFLDIKMMKDKDTSGSENGMSLAERIDEDYPESEKSSEYKGTSRATTPIGDVNVLDTEAFNAMLNLKGGKNAVFDVVSGNTKRSTSPSIDMEFENDFLKDLLELYEEQCGKSCKGVFGDVSIRDLCVGVSRDQEGSRCVQKKMEDASKDEISWFFSNIVDSASELSSNLFGNYVIQKIIPLLSDEERSRLVCELTGQIHLLSIHPYGCRVIQKMVDTFSDIDFILEEIGGNLLELIEDQNGNHVIQKCIEKCRDRRVILNQFNNNSLFLSTHKYGCRVVQRMMEFYDENEVKEIVGRLVMNIEALVDDQYGNYVIQHILSVGKESERSMVIERIMEKSYELSKCKFSSNVVEQCVKISSENQRVRFLSRFLEPMGSKSKLYFMCTDMYGNYVVQRLYDSSSECTQREIRNSLRPFIKDLKKSPFARHILFKIGS